MSADDRLSRKLSPGHEQSDTTGAAPSDAASHPAGAGPESDHDVARDSSPSPRDPESAGNEDLRVPGEDDPSADPPKDGES